MDENNLPDDDSHTSTPVDDQDSGVLGNLSDTAAKFLADPDADVADDDLPDDRSGVEVPQDGDPGR